MNFFNNDLEAAEQMAFDFLERTKNYLSLSPPTIAELSRNIIPVLQILDSRDDEISKNFARAIANRIVSMKNYVNFYSSLDPVDLDPEYREPVGDIMEQIETNLPRTQANTQQERFIRRKQQIRNELIPRLRNL